MGEPESSGAHQSGDGLIEGPIGLWGTTGHFAIDSAGRDAITNFRWLTGDRQILHVGYLFEPLDVLPIQPLSNGEMG